MSNSSTMGEKMCDTSAGRELQHYAVWSIAILLLLGTGYAKISGVNIKAMPSQIKKIEEDLEKIAKAAQAQKMKQDDLEKTQREVEEQQLGLTIIGSAYAENEIPTLVTDARGRITHPNLPAIKLLGGKYWVDIAGHDLSEWMRFDMRKKHMAGLANGQLPIGKTTKIECFLIVNDEQVKVLAEIKPVRIGKRIIHRVRLSKI